MNQTTDPLVSVLMPVKNAGAYLRPAVDSILAQSYSNLELIVVDDGSTDEAVSQLPTAPRLQVHSAVSQGISAATNQAAAIAKGQYLARMDADDIALPGRIDSQADYLSKHPDIGICGGKVEIFTTQGPPLGGYARYQAWINSICSPAEIAEQIYIESPIPNPTAMFRREVFEALNGFVDPPWHEDYDLYLRAHHSGIKMGKPDEVLLRWRDHDARSTRNQARYEQQQLIACKAHYLARHELANRPAILCGGGPVALALHDALEANAVQIQGFIDISPKRIGQQKRGKPVWSIDHIKPREALFLSALGTPDTRQAIDALYREHQMVPGRDFLHCA